MGDFKRGGFGGGRSGGFKKGGFSGGSRGSFGGGRGGFGGGRDNRGPVEMFPAVCAECGKNCKVPFRPSNDKPIYCNDCFGSKRDSQPRSDFRGRDRGSDFPPRDTKDNGNDELKRKIESIEKKLDTIIDLLGEIEIVDEEEEIKEKVEKKSKKK